MSAKILKGKPVADALMEKIKAKVENWDSREYAHSLQ